MRCDCSRGEPIYVDLQQFPMVRSPYPPLFPLLWSVVVPLTARRSGPGAAARVLSLGGLAGLVALNAWRVRLASGQSSARSGLRGGLAVRVPVGWVCACRHAGTAARRGRCGGGPVAARTARRRLAAVLCAAWPCGRSRRPSPPRSRSRWRWRFDPGARAQRSLRSSPSRAPALAWR